MRVIRAAVQTALRNPQLRRLGNGVLYRRPGIAARLLRIAGITLPYTPKYSNVARHELTEPAQAIYEDLRRVCHKRRARDRQMVRAMDSDSR